LHRPEGRLVRAIIQVEATTVCNVLRAVEHIPLTADVASDGTVNLHPQRELTTPERVAVLRAFGSVTDVCLHWDPAVKL
jgi:hypothetical protein